MKGQALAPMLPEGEAMPVVVVVQGMCGEAAGDEKIVALGTDSKQR